MPGKRVDHYDPGVLGKYRGHSIIHDDGTVEHFTNNGSLADGVTDGRYVGRSVIRKGESRVQRTRQGGGSSGGGGLGEALGGGLLLLLVLGPFYAAYLLLKGLVLSVLNRSVAPLLEWTTGACGVMALWSGVYALLWYAGLRLGEDVHAQPQVVQARGWCYFFGKILLISGLLTVIFSIVLRYFDRDEE